LSTTPDPELYCEIVGAGSPVVLLHGFSAQSGSWALQRRLLSARRRLVLPDLPGHGRSRLGAGAAPSIELFADRVAALLDRLEIERAHLVGFSLGGMVALALAARCGERLRSLVLSDTAAVRVPAGLRIAFEAMGLLGRLGLRPPARNIVIRGFPRPGPDAPPDLAEAWRGFAEHAAPSEIFRAAVAVARKRDYSDALPGLAAPTLVIVGADDPIRPLAEEMHRAIRGGELALFEGAGHGTPLLRPEAYGALLDDFFTRVEEGRPTGGERVIGPR
jgi:pimeloyl-ACP methyl ester carboxylesterase